MFRPVVCWLVASSLLFLWQYHHTQAARATIQFMVAVEGRSGQTLHDATLNGLPYQAGSPCGVGWKKLVVRAEDAESFQTNFFAWYGGASFGNITLPRSQGQVDLEFSPAVESVRIIGAEERKTLTNITRQSLSLPTGRYAMTARFARFSVERTVEVTRNQTVRVAISPEITTLHLSSDPDKAVFDLRSKAPPNVSASGTTPASMSDLPAGGYELVIAQGEYRKTLPIYLTGTKPTNELKVEFRYARVSFNSDPPDASVTVGGKTFGKTPVAVDLQPGSYHVEIVKDGFFGTNLLLTLSETDTRTVSVKLASVSFFEAIERARRQLSGLLVDYDRALADVEKALLIQPGDETALQLKRSIEFNRHLRNAKEFQRNREFPQALFEAEAALKLNANDADALAVKAEVQKSQLALEQARDRAKKQEEDAEAEARRNRPLKLFREIASGLRHFELFPSHLMRLSGSIDTTYAKVVGAFGREPEWKILRNDDLSENIKVIHAELKGFGWKQYVVLLLGQPADRELVVHFKLLSFTFDAAFLKEGGYKPNHPNFASADRAGVVEAYAKKDIQDFKKRLEEALHEPSK